MVSFRGLSAFPVTPAAADGHVDTEALRGLLRRLTAAGVDSIGLLGTTGSFPYLTRAERRRAIEAAVDEVRGKVPILVGIGALRTDETVRLAQDAAEAGAAAGLLAPVSYTPLTEAEVYTHFETVAQSTPLPICIYNNPGTTHFTFSAELIARLSRLPTIVAVKNPAPAGDAVAAHLGDLRTRARDGFSLGYSGDANATEAMLAGADTWYSVLAGLFPEPCVAIVRAARQGDAAEARRRDAALKPLWAVYARFGALRVMYAAGHRLGLFDHRPPRPILPLAGADSAAVEHALAAANLI